MKKKIWNAVFLTSVSSAHISINTKPNTHKASSGKQLNNRALIMNTEYSSGLLPEEESLDTTSWKYFHSAYKTFRRKKPQDFNLKHQTTKWHKMNDYKYFPVQKQWNDIFQAKHSVVPPNICQRLLLFNSLMSDIFKFIYLFLFYLFAWRICVCLEYLHVGPIWHFVPFQVLFYIILGSAINDIHMFFWFFFVYWRV